MVHGEDGLDEITLAGKTHVAEAHDGQVSTFEIAPGDFGFEAPHSTTCAAATLKRMRASCVPCSMDRVKTKRERW